MVTILRARYGEASASEGIVGTLQRPAPDWAILNDRPRIVRDLEKLVGKASVISDEDGCRSFETDALTAYAAKPLAVLLPGSTEEIAAILAYCHGKGVKVVPRGAGTSLAGGALPVEDGIVLGLGRMSRVLDIDYVNRTARVQAGITNLAVSEAVGANGFFYAPDPSSQLACTIAGNIAMNSGGAHCLKYGVTTNNVLGVKIVLIDGTIVDIGGAHLDAPGFDLLGLIVGSEGQFGVVTEAMLRILKKPEGARPMLMGFRSSEDAGAAVSRIIAAGIVPVAIEFMDKPAIEVCESFARAGYPLDVEAMLIIEVEGSEEEIDEALGKIRQLASAHNPTTVKISQSPAETAAIWRGRKSAFGAIGRVADYLCMDGTIPLSRLPETLTTIAAIARRYGFRAANIFHAGDGNLHPLILYDANEPGAVEQVEACGAEILKHCVAVGGCLTGEHGVGIEKRDLMPLQFTPVDLAQQTRLKRVFDAKWLLNPGKVFPLDSVEAA